jgi:hypothetical protein
VVGNVQQKYELTHYLVMFIFERYDTLEHHVRGVILQTIAISTKLGWNSSQDRTKQDVMNFLQQLMQDAAPKQKLGLALLISLLTEFQSAKASSLGLALDYHQTCQVSFQKEYLISLFQICLQAIHTAGRIENPKEQHEIITMAIRGSELILSWDFTTNAVSLIKNKDEVYLEGNQRVPLRLPSEWGVVLQVPEVVRLFFSLAHRFAEEASISARLTTCLTQLASVSGPVFMKPELKAEYFLNYIACFDEYVRSLQPSLQTDRLVDLGDKIFAVASIGKHIFKLSLDILSQTPITSQLMERIANLTVVCIKHPSQDLDDSWLLDAGDELLYMWSLFVNGLQEHSEKEIESMMAHPQVSTILGLLSVICTQLVSVYIEAKVLQSPSEHDDDFDEMEKDVDVYEDQLINIATLARLRPSDVLANMKQVLQEKHKQLLSHLQQASDETTGIIMVLQEQIHWGVLISGHILADAGTGETPEIAPSLQKLSMESRSDQDVIVMLPTVIFGILDSLTFPANSRQHTYCSPLLIETLFWFMDRWSSSYLFIEQTTYTRLSSNMQNAFGAASDGPKVLDFFLEKIYMQVLNWRSEVEVISQIIVVLQGLSKNRRIRDAMVQSTSFTALVKYFLSHMNQLPATTHSLVIQTIAYVATHCSDLSIRTQYFKHLSDTIETSLNAIIQDPNFLRTFGSTSTREAIIIVLEMFGGLALVVDEVTTVPVFETCARHFSTFVKLLDMFHSHPDLELYILQVVRDLVKNQFFDALESHHHKILYQTVHDMIQVYAKNEIGRHRNRKNYEEEELFEDLSVLLELLSALITSEYEGYERETVIARIQKAKFEIDVSTVVFVGVNSLLPLITQEMLEVTFPYSSFHAYA